MQRDSRWKWIAGLSLLVILAVFGSLFLRPSPRSVDVSPPTFKILQSEPDGQPAANAPVTADKPKPPSAVDSIDICGYGKVAIDATDPFAAGRYLSALTKETGGRWLSALLDSDDVRARAAGLLLESRLIGSGQVEPMAEQSRDALVQLAVGAGDPAIYAMAVYACNTYANAAASAACQQITLKSWANLDSDNAVPWLLLAGKAHTQQDFAAENAAFADAAKTHKVDAYNYSLYAYAEPDMPTDATALERWSLAVELVGIESAAGQLQYSSASKHCSADAMHDTDVRQQCSAIAELLVGKGTTFLDLDMGAAIGTRVGWEKTRVAALAEERDALLRVSMEATPSNNEELWTCDSARRGNAHMGQWARLGEIGAARVSLAGSGETVSELAKRQRDFMDKFRRDAQQRAESSAFETPP